MKIKVNGKEQTVEENISIENLLKQNDVTNTEMVTVQLNGTFVDKSNFSAQEVKENDEIEYIYFMGGGTF